MVYISEFINDGSFKIVLHVLFQMRVRPVQKILNGVGADGVGVKLPIFPANCSRLLLSQVNRRETKKREEKKDNPSDPIWRLHTECLKEV